MAYQYELGKAGLVKYLAPNYLELCLVEAT